MCLPGICWAVGALWFTSPKRECFQQPKTTTYQLNILPRVTHSIYKTGAKKTQLTKKDSFKPLITSAEFYLEN